jgi:hypothetical protein
MKKLDNFILNHPLLSILGIAAILATEGLLVAPISFLPIASSLWAVFIVTSVISKKK